MAHSDALIFLTNITWIFFLFLFTYFFFVMFVLPSFYKKFRMRVLFKKKTFLGGLLSVRDLTSTVLLRLEFIVESYSLLTSVIRTSVKFFNGAASASTLSAISQTSNNNQITN